MGRRRARFDGLPAGGTKSADWNRSPVYPESGRSVRSRPRSRDWAPAPRARDGIPARSRGMAAWRRGPVRIFPPTPGRSSSSGSRRGRIDGGTRSASASGTGSGSGGPPELERIPVPALAGDGEVPPYSPHVTLLRRAGLAPLLAISGVNVAIFTSSPSSYCEPVVVFRRRHGTPDLTFCRRSSRCRRPGPTFFWPGLPRRPSARRA